MCLNFTNRTVIFENWFMYLLKDSLTTDCNDSIIAIQLIAHKTYEIKLGIPESELATHLSKNTSAIPTNTRY